MTIICYTCQRPKAATLKQRGSMNYCPEDTRCAEYAAGFRAGKAAAAEAVENAASLAQKVMRLERELATVRTQGRKEVVALLKDIVAGAKANAEDVAGLGLEAEARARALAAVFVEDALVCANFDDTHRGIIDVHPKA